MTTDPRNPGPHSRACGIRPHPHGSECHSNCPTCGGSVFVEDEQPERTRRVAISVLTTTGHSLTSDAADWTDEQLAQMRELLQNFEDLNYLTLEVGGDEITFNPRYLVSVTIHDKEN